MNWLFVGDDVHILLEKKAKGFVVIGLGTKGNEADVIQVQKTGAGGSSIEVKDCTFITRAPPVCTEASQDWTIVHQESTADGFKVELKRKAVSTDTTSDKTYVKGASNAMIWSMGTQNNVVKHEGPEGTTYGRFTLVMDENHSSNSSSFINTLGCVLSSLLITATIGF